MTARATGWLRRARAAASTFPVLCAGGCASLLGIDEPNVVGDAGSDVTLGQDAHGTDAQGADAGADAPGTTDAMPGDGSGPDVTLVTVLPQGQVTNNNVQFFLSDTGGALLVVVAYWTATAEVGVSDTAGNTWNSTTAANGAGTWLQVWYATNIHTSPNNVVTVAVPVPADAGNLMGGVLLEYAGLANPTFDVLAHNSGPASSIPMSTGSFVTTGQADLVIGAFADVSDLGVFVAGPGFASEATDTAYATIVEDDPPYALPPGTHDLTAMLSTDAGTGYWLGLAAAFKSN